MEFITVFIFVIIAILILAVSLYFSKFKKRKTGCCAHAPKGSLGSADAEACSCSDEEKQIR
jgi:hypothetical protein